MSTSELRFSKDNLIWIDCEFSGLNERDRILEIAVVVTDKSLTTRVDGPVIAINQPNHVLDTMDIWCKNTHRMSGLTDRVKDSTISELQAETQIVHFLKQYVPTYTSPMCGNSIHVDRTFIKKYMNTLYWYCHFQNHDVSSVGHTTTSLGVPKFRRKESGKHSALSDIHSSIEEELYYRSKLIAR